MKSVRLAACLAVLALTGCSVASESATDGEPETASGAQALSKDGLDWPRKVPTPLVSPKIPKIATHHCASWDDACRDAATCPTIASRFERGQWVGKKLFVPEFDERLLCEYEWTGALPVSAAARSLLDSTTAQIADITLTSADLEGGTSVAQPSSSALIAPTTPLPVGGYHSCPTCLFVTDKSIFVVMPSYWKGEKLTVTSRGARYRFLAPQQGALQISRFVLKPDGSIITLTNPNVEALGLQVAGSL